MTAGKTRRRLFAPELPEGGGELRLPEASVHHARVLRLEAGTVVELFDGQGGRAEATLTLVTRDLVRCRASARERVAPQRPVLHLVLGLPKGNKLEPIVRMLTELGVGELHLARCERSVPKPGEDSARLSRLARIAVEACAQSGQALAPVIHPPAPLPEIALRAGDGACKLVFWERASSGLSAMRIAAGCQQIWVVVGPEGGLGEGEVQALCEQGYLEVGLGPALLRVETAAPVIAALVLAQLGRFGG